MQGYENCNRKNSDFKNKTHVAAFTEICNSNNTDQDEQAKKHYKKQGQGKDH